MTRRVLGALAAAGAVLMSWGAVSQPRASTRSPGADGPGARRAPLVRMGIAPVSAGSGGHYELRSSHASAVFGETGLTLRLPSRVRQERELGWRVAGGRRVTPRAEQPREAKLHRLVGPRAEWEQDVPTYGGLRYRGVLPGVDLWFEERAEGHEYGFRAERGADLRRVRLEYAGARAVRVVEEGRALEVDLGEGVLRERGLRCAQEAVDGSSRAVGCRFADARPVGLDRWEYAIEVDVADPERPVVVDPLVLWNTYLGGGSGIDELRGIAQNAAGEVYVVGTVGGSSVAPPRDAGIGSLGGLSDVFVASFKADGGLSWSTLLGGDGIEFGDAILVGSANEVYVAGTTTSPNLRGRLADGGVGDSLQGGSDGFVARLSPSGAALDWLIHVGGSSDDTVNKLVSNGAGKLFAVGETLSGDLPRVAGRPITLPVVDWEGFVTSIDVTQPRTDWFVVHQAAGDESVLDVAYKNEVGGLVYFTGGTRSLTDTSRDAFLGTIVGADGDTPVFQSRIVRLGGSQSDEGRALSFTPSDVVMWGYTDSPTFPADAGSRKGPSDIFVAVIGDWLGSSGNMPVKQSLLIGGSNGEELFSVTTDSSGRFYLGGSTTSPDFPVRNAFDSQHEVGLDGFVARVRLDVEPAVQWASFVGGTDFEEVYALKVDDLNEDRLFIGGYTASSNLRYSDAGYRPSQIGNQDMFLMAVDVNALPDGGRLDPDAVESDDGGVGGPDGSVGGPDGSVGEPDGSVGGPDGGVGGPDAGGDGGTEGPRSPLGWSCGATDTGGGPRALALGVLVGLALFVSRRKPRA